ncbi:hypothetical protein Q4543_16890 [Salipiger sp. 1_MG-2023]|uniref:hypothetical protein n=1 Tax=Salipiger sp. 1_MG-2023 TaxID=3062665 RepID=UPI0026E1C805|nr:hypothetical protein [Salipiger sp. 1_MG-2023]MDO6587192.1 hypothetical protein [Salipiger sp. 1_MG-2023]
MGNDLQVDAVLWETASRSIALRAGQGRQAPDSMVFPVVSIRFDVSSTAIPDKRQENLDRFGAFQNAIKSK